MAIGYSGRVLINIVTGSTYPLAGSVEQPRVSPHRHDVTSEVSSVPPWSQLHTNDSDPYPTQKYGSYILRVWLNRSYSPLSLWREVSMNAKSRVILQSLLNELLTSCQSFLLMMRVSTLFLHGGKIWENNSLYYYTSLVQYTNWPSVKEAESLTNCNSLHVNSRNVSV